MVIMHSKELYLVYTFTLRQSVLKKAEKILIRFFIEDIF